MLGLAWLCPALAELGLGDPAGARRFAPPAGTTADSWKHRIWDRRGRVGGAVGGACRAGARRSGAGARGSGRGLPSWGSAIRGRRSGADAGYAPLVGKRRLVGESGSKPVRWVRRGGHGRGVAQEIDDEAATAFAVGFHQAMGAGLSIWSRNGCRRHRTPTVHNTTSPCVAEGGGLGRLCMPVAVPDGRTKSPLVKQRALRSLKLRRTDRYLTQTSRRRSCWHLHDNPVMNHRFHPTGDR